MTFDPSLIISILALGATFAGAHYSRQHNRLSVRPYLSIWQGTTEDNEGFAQVKLKVANNGLGPAIIGLLEISFDGKPIGSNKNIKELSRNIVKEIGPHISYTVKYDLISVNSTIAAGEGIDIITINFLEENFVIEKKINTLIHKFDLKIDYESMYRIKYKCNPPNALNALSIQNSVTSE